MAFTIFMLFIYLAGYPRNPLYPNVVSAWSREAEHPHACNPSSTCAFVLSEQVNLIGNARLKALEVTCSQLYHAMLP